jgi:hypothetical protein
LRLTINAGNTEVIICKLIPDAAENDTELEISGEELGEPAKEEEIGIIKK